jgi:hypothetical protein
VRLDISCGEFKPCPYHAVAVGIVRRYMITFQVKSQVSISKNHPTPLNRGYETFPLPYPRDLRKGFLQVFQLHLQKNVLIIPTRQNLCWHGPQQHLSPYRPPILPCFLLRSQRRISRLKPSTPFSHSDSDAKAFQKLTTPSDTLMQPIPKTSRQKVSRSFWDMDSGLENKFPDAGRFFGPAGNGEDKSDKRHECARTIPNLEARLHPKLSHWEGKIPSR